MPPNVRPRTSKVTLIRLIERNLNSHVEPVVLNRAKIRRVKLAGGGEVSKSASLNEMLTLCKNLPNLTKSVKCFEINALRV